jgi:hypothetical protein
MRSIRSRRHVARTLVVALCVLQIGATSSPVFAQSEPYLSPDLLKAESGQAEPFGNALSQYLQQYSKLKKQTAVAPADLAQLQRTGESVKAQLGSMQVAMRGAISKLRGAGKWTPELDAFVEQQMRKAGASPAALQLIARGGGFRAVVQEAANIGGQLGAEIDGDITALQRPAGVFGQLLEALLGTPVSCTGALVACKALSATTGLLFAAAFGLGSPVMAMAIGAGLNDLYCTADWAK